MPKPLVNLNHRRLGRYPTARSPIGHQRRKHPQAQPNQRQGNPPPVPEPPTVRFPISMTRHTGASAHARILPRQTLKSKSIDPIARKNRAQKHPQTHHHMHRAGQPQTQPSQCPALRKEKSKPHKNKRISRNLGLHSPHDPLAGQMPPSHPKTPNPCAQGPYPSPRDPVD